MNYNQPILGKYVLLKDETPDSTIFHIGEIVGIKFSYKHPYDTTIKDNKLYFIGSDDNIEICGFNQPIKKTTLPFYIQNSKKYKYFYEVPAFYLETFQRTVPNSFEWFINKIKQTNHKNYTNKFFAINIKIFKNMTKKEIKNEAPCSFINSLIMIANLYRNEETQKEINSLPF